MILIESIQKKIFCMKQFGENFPMLNHESKINRTLHLKVHLNAKEIYFQEKSISWHSTMVIMVYQSFHPNATKCMTLFLTMQIHRIKSKFFGSFHESITSLQQNEDLLSSTQYFKK